MMFNAATVDSLWERSVKESLLSPDLGSNVRPLVDGWTVAFVKRVFDCLPNYYRKSPCFYRYARQANQRRRAEGGSGWASLLAAHAMA